jgi:hypothetical protein
VGYARAASRRWPLVTRTPALCAVLLAACGSDPAGPTDAAAEDAGAGEGSPPDAASPRETDLIVPSGDVVYEGRFKLPSAGTDMRWTCLDGAGYNNPGMSITADGNLYVIGGVDYNCGFVGEVSVPEALSSTTTPYASLVEGTRTHDLVRVGTKTLEGTYLRLGDIRALPAHGTQDTAKLYLTYYESYSADDHLLLGQIEPDLDSGLPCSSFWQLEGKTLERGESPGRLGAPLTRRSPPASGRDRAG